MGKTETFDFLGFTFYCGETMDGKFCVIPKNKQQEVSDEAERDEPIAEGTQKPSAQGTDAEAESSSNCKCCYEEPYEGKQLVRF